MGLRSLYQRTQRPEGCTQQTLAFSTALKQRLCRSVKGDVCRCVHLLSNGCDAGTQRPPCRSNEVAPAGRAGQAGWQRCMRSVIDACKRRKPMRIAHQRSGFPSARGIRRLFSNGSVIGLPARPVTSIASTGEGGQDLRGRLAGESGRVLGQSCTCGGLLPRCAATGTHDLALRLWT